MKDDLPARLAAIGELDLDRLRRRWRMLSGKPASANLPRALLLRLIGYRIQSDALGGLDRETRRVLDGVARSLREGTGKGQTVPPRAELRRLLPGTHLVREHDGVMHRVMVLEEGFAWNGTVYGSLSTLAHAITGTKWNGYRFFGLKEVKARAADPCRARSRAIDRLRSIAGPGGGPMKMERPKALRCAIYTRVSTEHGLDQDFNSLQAQREASEAYIKSQAHEGWRLTAGTYDDGGFSGASLERPALQRLLEEVRQGRIDVVVVYKVDRLTRSLSDFARLVDAFDQHGVSFVSVTQSFNTTTSMGRLTLNVLLSFAQFEREVTGERIRDKIAASKRKGIWMGGTVPFGYRVEARKLLIEPTEAETVRMIFQRYLEVGSLPALQLDLKLRGILTRARPMASGTIRGGIAFTTGPLSLLLRNRVYLGEIRHKGKYWPGEHQPIVDAKLFEAVRQKLSQNLTAHQTRLTRSDALLMGRIFDDRGNRMTPSHASKGPARYRYYISSAMAKGRADEAGSVVRVPAPDIEKAVLDALRQHVAERIHSARIDGSGSVDSWAAKAVLSDRDLVATLIESITIESGSVRIKLQQSVAEDGETPSEANDATDAPHPDQAASGPILVPWSPLVSRRRRAMIRPHTPSEPNLRPMRDSVRANLLKAIARGRTWLEQILSGEAASIEVIALREKCTSRSARQTLSLAFLSPTILRAIVDGRLPRGIASARLVDLPLEWERQHQLIGVAPIHCNGAAV